MDKRKDRYLTTLRALCELDGVSGDESAVAEYVRARAEKYAESVVTDSMGNVIVKVRGAKRRPEPLLVAAHMDEVGFAVKAVGEDGIIRIAPSGGFDVKVLPARVVRFKNGARGVIGMKAVHLTTAEERQKPLGFDKLYLDIGAESREEAMKIVELGDYAAFDSGFEFFGDGCMKAKAFDDRAGCAVMLGLIESPLEYDTDFAFTVQEEVGTRGAVIAAKRTRPSRALILEGTTACDVMDTPNGREVCSLGKGAVCPFMDGGAIYDKVGFDALYAMAAELGLPIQTKKMAAGGTDARVIATANTGARVNALSLPIRYLHAAATVAKTDDFAAMCAIAEKFVNTEKIGE